MSGTTEQLPVNVYWQPGCSSCLRTKEFLSQRGIAYVSRNIVSDEGALEEMARFGLKRVPIVIRGDEWADGQVLADVARIVGVPFQAPKALSTDELYRRLQAILAGTERFLQQIPDADLQRTIPQGPRTYAVLSYHLFNVADTFLEHEAGIPTTFASYNRAPEPGDRTRAFITAYGRDVQARLKAWFDGAGRGVDWSRKADVYYGDQTALQFFERTTWHAGQHARQVMWYLDQLGTVPNGRLGQETFGGLPMPDSIWEDQAKAA